MQPLSKEEMLKRAKELLLKKKTSPVEKDKDIARDILLNIRLMLAHKQF